MNKLEQPFTTLQKHVQPCTTTYKLVQPCITMYGHVQFLEHCTTLDNYIQPCTYKHIDSTCLFIAQILYEYGPNIVQRLHKYCLHIVKILLTNFAFYRFEMA